MSTNALLDIAIGLIVMYLVLSLICTSVNEFIATVTRLRAANLRKSLTHIIDNEQVRNVFKTHGLIAASNPAGFSQSAYLPGSIFALALLDSLDPDKSPTVFADIEAAARSLPDSNVRDLLVANIAMAKGSLDQLRKNLASSFDHMMDRVSGVYKRQLKWISLGLGFAMALAINADTIAMGNSLWSDGLVRAEMIQTAQAMSGLAVSTTNTAGDLKIADLVQGLRTAEKQLRPLPLGWDFGSSNWTIGFWSLKLAGLAITAAAVMLGAPFWFDLLSKFMRIRGTGDRPARTSE